MTDNNLTPDQLEILYRFRAWVGGKRLSRQVHECHFSYEDCLDDLCLFMDQMQGDHDLPSLRRPFTEFFKNVIRENLIRCCPWLGCPMREGTRTPEAPQETSETPDGEKRCERPSA